MVVPSLGSDEVFEGRSDRDCDCPCRKEQAPAWLLLPPLCHNATNLMTHISKYALQRLLSLASGFKVPRTFTRKNVTPSKTSSLLEGRLDKATHHPSVLCARPSCSSRHVRFSYPYYPCGYHLAAASAMSVRLSAWCTGDPCWSSFLRDAQLHRAAAQPGP